MSTTEREILDRLYSSLREAQTWAGRMADPVRLRTLVAKTDYEHLYDALEIVEGCARQMTAWSEDTRCLEVSRTIGVLVQKLKEWTTVDNLFLFRSVQGFLANAEKTCKLLETAATHRIGAILPDAIIGRESHRDANLHTVRALDPAKGSIIH